MGYICAVSAIVLAVLFYLLTRKVYNAGTLFFGYWALILFLTSLNPDHATPVRQSTYGLILLGLLSFAAGCLVSYFLGRKPKESQEYHFEIRDYTWINLICLIIIAYSIYRIGIVISFHSQGFSWGEIRQMHGFAGETGDDTLRGNTLSQLIHDDLVAPCVYLIVPLFSVELFLGKQKISFLLISAAAITLYSFASVSRAVWAFSILYVFVILIIFAHSRKVSLRTRRRLRLIPVLAGLLFIVVLVITLGRSESSQINLGYNALAYLSGGVQLFDIRLQEPIADLRTYGLLSLYGFLFPIFFVLNYFGILKYPAVFGDVTAIKQQLEQYVTISEHVRMNAYCTMFFNFYNDFGVFGVFLGSFLFGFFCMLAYSFFVRRKNTRSLVCYLILIQFMFFSVARIYTIYTTRALTLVWLMLLIPKENRQRIKFTLK